jgi:hypothetical protein
VARPRDNHRPATLARHLVRQSSRWTWSVEWSDMRETAQPRHSVPRAGTFGASSILSRHSAFCQEEFRIWCRVTTASSPTGGPPDPLGGRAAPRIPLLKPHHWCAGKPTGAVQSLNGADISSPGWPSWNCGWAVELPSWWMWRGIFRVGTIPRTAAMHAAPHRGNILMVGDQ